MRIRGRPPHFQEGKPMNEFRGHESIARHHVQRAGTATAAIIGANPNGRVEIAGDEYSWYPPPELRDQFPTDFRLRFVCRSIDGARCFLPAGPIPDFATQASFGGLALLTRDRGLDAEYRSIYHWMRYIWQHSPLVQEGVSPRFHTESDLYAAYALRGDPRDVLPDTVGLDAAGNGDRWSAVRLVTEGRGAALAAGEDPTDTARCIRRGTLEAARLAPVDPQTLSADQMLANVRSALFVPGGEPGADEYQNTRVYDRLFDLTRKKIGDRRNKGETPAAFAKWLGDVNNLLHGISKRTKGGGKIPRGVVRQAYLDLIWSSFRYTGNTLEYQMQAFAAALPDPLTPAERLYFDPLYRGQPYLGGLPLMLIVDRFGFFAEALQEVWARPGDDRPVGVLLRLISWYGEMSAKRRAADVHAKRRGEARTKGGTVARDLPLDRDDEVPDRSDLDVFGAIAATLRELRGRPCACGTSAGWIDRLADDAGPPDVVRIEERCEACGTTRYADYSKEEFHRVAVMWKDAGD
jgi:hypothetical protein